jgi:hypothetical protein
MGHWRNPPKPKLLPEGHTPRIVSRWESFAEKEFMQGWVDTLKPETMRYIIEVFCDSKACAYYVLRLCRPVSNAEQLGRHLADYIHANASGFNGIVIQYGDQNLCTLDPEWNEST